MLVKICGLSSVDSLEAAISAGADMAGFVFFPKSPRHLELDRACVLGAIAAGRITKVAMLVDAPDDIIAGVTNSLRPDILQLHGHETSARVAEIKARFRLPVMRAFGIFGRADLATSIRDGADADYLLFDAKPPASGLPGGNGVTFDWEIMTGMTFSRPWLLSGGLNCENVAKAIQLTQPRGVDVSSGVESSPGVKDNAKIREFVARSRNARQTG